MVKVLIADSYLTKDKNHYEFLNKYNNKFEILKSTSGTDTIKKCSLFSPEIILMDTGFTDMPYDKVIDEIANLPNEYHKTNLILNVEKEKDRRLLKNTSVIYKIFGMPFDEKEELESIYELKAEYEKPNVSLLEIKDLLLSLGIHTYSIASQYLSFAIWVSYYHPEKFRTFKSVCIYIAKKYSVSHTSVESSIKHLVVTFNNRYNSGDLFLKIFKSYDYVSAKLFIERIVTYFENEKSKI